MTMAGTPAGPPTDLRQVRERDVVDPHGDDELVVRQRLLRRVGHRDLVAYAAAPGVAARPGDHHDDLYRLLPDRILNADPERRPAGEIEDIGPDLVAVARQPGPQPAHELVVIRGSMTDENDIAV